MSGKNTKIKDLSPAQLMTIIQEGVNSAIKKKKLQELSPDTYQSATQKMRDSGQDTRALNMGNKFFHTFIGKPLLGGTISNITSPDSNNIFIHLEYEREGHGFTKDQSLVYQIKNDLYPAYDKNHGKGKGLTRQDARILSLIAQKINPNTQYKQPGQKFNIEGY